MSRPRKQRYVCGELSRLHCESGGSGPVVDLAADELESLRLCDLEELEQDAAAERMGVSRGTFQRLLYSARRKVAFSLVAGRPIGVGRTPEEVRTICPRGEKKCRFCPERINNNTQGVVNMKIAVASENEQVFQHFGHTPEFTVFDVEDGKIAGMRILPTDGTGHGALAGFLAEHDVKLLICGGIGGGAQMALAEAGVQLVAGVEGRVLDAIAGYLKGTLEANPDFTCHHHDGESGHSCGAHGCGNHSCH